MRSAVSLAFVLLCSNPKKTHTLLPSPRCKHPHLCQPLQSAQRLLALLQLQLHLNNRRSAKEAMMTTLITHIHAYYTYPRLLHISMLITHIHTYYTYPRLLHISSGPMNTRWMGSGGRLLQVYYAPKVHNRPADLSQEEVPCPMIGQREGLQCRRGAAQRAEGLGREQRRGGGVSEWKGEIGIRKSDWSQVGDGYLEIREALRVDGQ